MKVINTVLIVLCSAFQGVVCGPWCYSCEKVFMPAICGLVQKCADSESCFAAEHEGLNGGNQYRSGCLPTNKCPPKTSKRTTGDNPETCNQCCDGDFCNSQLCGGAPIKTGSLKLCMKCDAVQSPEQCDQVDTCGPDQQCYVKKVEHFGLHYFTLGCEERAVCAMKNYSCCDTDVCNAYSNITSATAAPQQSTGSATTISASSGASASSASSQPSAAASTDVATPGVTTTTPTTQPTTTTPTTTAQPTTQPTTESTTAATTTTIMPTTTLPTTTLQTSTLPTTTLQTSTLPTTTVQTSTLPTTTLPTTILPTTTLPTTTLSTTTLPTTTTPTTTTTTTTPTTTLPTTTTMPTTSTTTTTTTTTVGIPPSISNPQQTVNVTIKQNLTLSCDISGQPTPDVTWTYPKPHGLGNERPNGTKVYITHVFKENNGTYTCVGENNHGRVNGTINVNVKEPVTVKLDPPIVVLDPSAMHKPARLKCLSHGQPEPKVTWSYANGTQVANNANIMVFTDDLFIRGIDPGNFKNFIGIFVCKGDNGETSSEKYQVVAGKLPRVLDEKNKFKDLGGEHGEAFYVKCADGLTEPDGSSRDKEFDSTEAVCVSARKVGVIGKEAGYVYYYFKANDKVQFIDPKEGLKHI